MTKPKRELAASLVFAIFSIFYFIYALTIKKYNAFGGAQVDSQSIPKILGAVLFVLSLVRVRGALKESSGSKAMGSCADAAPATIATSGGRDLNAELVAAEKSEADSPIDGKSVWLTLLFLVVYAALMEPVGFPLMTLAYLIAQIVLLTGPEKRVRRLPLIVGISIVFTIAVYLLFTRGLLLILPSGILG